MLHTDPINGDVINVKSAVYPYVTLLRGRPYSPVPTVLTRWLEQRHADTRTTKTRRAKAAV